MAILARSVLQHLEPRVIAALPVQHEVQPTGLDSHDDLIQHGAQNPLARLKGSSGIVPERRQIPVSAMSVARASSPTALGSSSRKPRICSSSRFDSTFGPQVAVLNFGSVARFRSSTRASPSSAAASAIASRATCSWTRFALSTLGGEVGKTFHVGLGAHYAF
jgi:hypothetical protein